MLKIYKFYNTSLTLMKIFIGFFKKYYFTKNGIFTSIVIKMLKKIGKNTMSITVGPLQVNILQVIGPQ